MVLSQIASISTAVSGFAVTASLIYVGIQTKQNVRHTRALIHQGTAARTSNLLARFMSADAVEAWIVGNGRTPTPESIKERQFYYYCGMMMIAMEDYFSQHEDGLLSNEQFSRGKATFQERLQEPGVRAYWLKEREKILEAAPRYCAFVDSLCSGETVSPDGSIERSV